MVLQTDGRTEVAEDIEPFGSTLGPISSFYVSKQPSLLQLLSAFICMKYLESISNSPSKFHHVGLSYCDQNFVLHLLKKTHAGIGIFCTTFRGRQNIVCDSQNTMTVSRKMFI